MIPRTFYEIPNREGSKHADFEGKLFIRESTELDRRWLPHRAVSKTSAFARLCWAWISHQLSAKAARTVSLDNTQGRVGLWGRDTTALYIFLHGLGANGLCWCDYVAELVEKDPNSAIFIPTLAEELSPSKNLANEVYTNISSLLAAAPSVRVCIVGFSNGVRIAAELEMLLRAHNHNVQLVSIAGLFYGTYWVNLFKNTFWAFGKSAALENMEYGNEESKTLIQSMRDVRTGIPPRRFIFYVTTEDFHVVPSRGSAPCLGLGELVFIMHGVLHEEMFDLVRPSVVSMCLEFAHGGNPPEEEDDIW